MALLGFGKALPAPGSLPDVGAIGSPGSGLPCLHQISVSRRFHSQQQLIAKGHSPIQGLMG